MIHSIFDFSKTFYVKILQTLKNINWDWFKIDFEF